MKRRRFKQTVSLEDRLAEEAKRLREEAELLPMDLHAMTRSVGLGNQVLAQAAPESGVGRLARTLTAARAAALAPPGQDQLPP
jgi:hypothetical protein